MDRHPEARAKRASKGDGIDLGFTRDRQFKLRKSAAADLRGRASFEALATLGRLWMTGHCLLPLVLEHAARSFSHPERKGQEARLLNHRIVKLGIRSAATPG